MVSNDVYDVKPVWSCIKSFMHIVESIFDTAIDISVFAKLPTALTVIVAYPSDIPVIKPFSLLLQH